MDDLKYVEALSWQARSEVFPLHDNRIQSGFPNNMPVKRYTIDVYAAHDGDGFEAVCPDVPEAFGWGKDVCGAMVMICNDIASILSSPDGRHYA